MVNFVWCKYTIPRNVIQWGGGVIWNGSKLCGVLAYCGGLYYLCVEICYLNNRINPVCWVYNLLITLQGY